jgi:ATP-binding cassette subfamily F protein uup
VLEEYLRDFAGCVIVVSHDRYFMDKIVDHLLVFNGQGDIRDFPGNYTQYREWKEEADRQQAAINRQQTQQKNINTSQKAIDHSQSSVDSKSRKKTFKERQEFAAVEVAIADLEAEKAAIEEALCTGTLTAEELTQESIRLSALNEELDEKTMRWLELSEIPD